MPTAVAIQWVEVTTPNVPSISGRVVNGLGLIFDMISNVAGAATVPQRDAPWRPDYMAGQRLKYRFSAEIPLFPLE